MMKLSDLEQQKDYTCGPAVIRAWVLLKSDTKLPSEPAVEKGAHTTKAHGTTPENLLAYALGKGYDGKLLSAKIMRPYDIALVQENNYGHWIIITKISDDHVHYFDPWTGGIITTNVYKLDRVATVKNRKYRNCVIRLS